MDDGVETGPGSHTLSAHYDWSMTSPCYAVVSAIAIFENVEPGALAAELETTLYEHVDPDVLETLFVDERVDDLAVTFSVDRYRVRVDDDGITITQLADS